MSRKHPSFDQLIDYIESERKLKSKQFSVFHNIYHRNSDHIKNEFRENAEQLKFRKNGVYLYHEVISITRTNQIEETQQKAILKEIVQKYLEKRAKNNLAYAVLHEDKKDNLHFHIVISANEAESQKRTRIAKADFSQIQTELEKWVLETYPKLEQKAVFYQNQTDQEREEAEHKARISNKGRELKRRTGTASKRDAMQEKLKTIFEVAQNGQHFADILKSEGLSLYQRGKQYGITDREGIKYRFSTLGLTEEWEALDKRMMADLQKQQAQVKTAQTQPQATIKTAEKPQEKQRQDETMKPQTEQKENLKETLASEASTATKGTSPFTVAKEFVLHPTDNPIQREMEEERQRRLAEAEEMRKAKAENQASTGLRNSNKNQQS